MNSNSIVWERQRPLAASYFQDPSLAMITDGAWVASDMQEDPFHTYVRINPELGVPFTVGVHRAVGGYHDFPNPGDILCTALAACFDSTMRLVADRLQVRLVSTDIKATARVDVRGTLMLDRNVPVGFQSMLLEVHVGVEPGTDERLIRKLLKATENSCVIFQTLKGGVPVEIQPRIEEKAWAAVEPAA